jgi:hypothetical protein
MLGDHAQIAVCMTEQSRNDMHRHIVHCQVRTVAVPQDVVADCWLDFGEFARRLHPVCLLAVIPCFALVPALCVGKHNFGRIPASTDAGKERLTFVGKRYPARFAAFRPLNPGPGRVFDVAGRRPP